MEGGIQKDEIDFHSMHCCYKSYHCSAVAVSLWQQLVSNSYSSFNSDLITQFVLVMVHFKWEGRPLAEFLLMRWEGTDHVMCCYKSYRYSAVVVSLWQQVVSNSDSSLNSDLVTYFVLVLVHFRWEGMPPAEFLFMIRK